MRFVDSSQVSGASRVLLVMDVTDGGVEQLAVRVPDAAARFLVTAFEADDFAAVLLRAVGAPKVLQRVDSVPRLASTRLGQLLRRVDGTLVHVHVSINPLRPGSRSRTRDAVGPVRHILLDADARGDAVLAEVVSRRSLPPLSYVLRTSPGRLHLFWRVVDFDHDTAERLQRQLARELGTDPAATPVTQMTRVPGFLNHKHSPPPLVTIEYRDRGRRFTPKDFPPISVGRSVSTPAHFFVGAARPETNWRARRYLTAVRPAVQGQHGDLRTFQVCCRLVRGFALSLDQALLLLLSEWNTHCQPPWSEAELVAKLRSAARNGREPFGGLL